MKISRTHRATPSLSLPGPSSTEQHGVAEPRPNTNDSFESSRLKDTVTYGALGGLTASLPLLGLVSNSNMVCAAASVAVSVQQGKNFLHDHWCGFMQSLQGWAAKIIIWGLPA